MNDNIGSLLMKNRQNEKNALLHDRSITLSHKELDLKSNRVANFLRMQGISKGDRIAIFANNSLDLITIIFGILKLGAIYVPIDKNKKRVQIKSIIDFTEPKILFSDVVVDYDLGNKLKVILINKKTMSSVYNYSPKYNNEKNIYGIDPAYIIFSSGTTGNPKGITMSHGSILNFTYDVVKRFNHTRTDRTLCRTPASFDPFLTEILPSIISGGQIYLQDRNASLVNLFKMIQEHKITNFGCGPALFHLMVQSEAIMRKYNLSSLREIYFGYEKMSTNLLQKMQNLLPDVTFINGYGTSETFAATTYYICPFMPNDVYIGKAIESAGVLLWNHREHRACKNGEMGEIIIFGNTLMNGYWKNENLTKKVIRAHPENKNQKAYYTNDIGMYIENQIKFIGRLDSQIKLNGKRVNLEEIREALYTHYDIKEAIVYKQNSILVCEFNRFSVLEDFEDIKEYLVNILESDKIPSKWIYKDSLKRNENSKLLIPKS